MTVLQFGSGHFTSSNLHSSTCSWRERGLWKGYFPWKRFGWTISVNTARRCSWSFAGLLFCSHQADLRMRLHRLFRLDDNCCKLVSLLQVDNMLDASWLSRLLLHQAWCKLFQVASSLISTGLMQLVMTNLHQVGKIDNLEQVCGFYGCVTPPKRKRVFQRYTLWKIHVTKRNMFW